MTHPHPRTAVVIVNYNSAGLVKRAIACLNRQTRPADHIVVVDNHSTDPDTEELLNRLAAESIQVLRMDSNTGYGAAINHATSQLPETTDLLLTLNPDAFPRPDWIEQLTRAAADNPRVGSFASLQVSADDHDVIDGAGDVYHLSGLVWRQFHGRHKADVTISSGPVFSACGGAAMYRLDAFQRAGGFDEAFFMYLEDVDLGFRLQLLGYPCLLVADAVVEHIGSAVTGKTSDFTVYHGHRNLVTAYFKNMPLPLLIITLPIHIAMNLVTLVYFTLKGRGGVILKAKLDACRRIPGALSARRRPEDNVAIWPLLNKGLNRY